jgi:hypothetical protein
MALLARITVVALDSPQILVKLTIFVRTYRMKAQVIVRSIHRRITTPWHKNNIETVRYFCGFKTSTNNKKRHRYTYSDGGRQHPASIGVNSADFNCLMVLYFLESFRHCSDLTRQLFSLIQLLVLLSCFRNHEL